MSSTNLLLEHLIDHAVLLHQRDPRKLGRHHHDAKEVPAATYRTITKVQMSGKAITIDDIHIEHIRT